MCLSLNMTAAFRFDLRPLLSQYSADLRLTPRPKHEAIDMVKISAIICMLLVCTGCSEKPPVSEQDATIYQRAVYYNPIRPNEDSDQDSARKPAEIMAFAGVKPGMRIIDLLGGGGWYAELLAAVVGEQGHVYLANTPLFLNFTREQIDVRLANNRLKNVTRIDGEWTAMDLPDKVDLIWLSLAYHDIYVKRPNDPDFEADRDSFFRQINAALKPGGLLLVIDHAAIRGSGSEAAQSLHRIDEEFARADFEKEGFILLKSLDILRNPEDDYSKDIWNKAVINDTDKFIYLFKKTEDKVSAN